MSLALSRSWQHKGCDRGDGSISFWFRELEKYGLMNKVEREIIDKLRMKETGLRRLKWHDGHPVCGCDRSE